MNRHFILTNGRSGSNYFAQLLNQHAAVVNYGEVLGDWTFTGKWLRPRFGDNSAAFLDWLYESRLAFYGGQIHSYLARRRGGKATHFRRRQAVESLGVKEFAVNVTRFGLETFLEERPEIRLIALVRSDPLARLLSVRQLAMTGEVARIAGPAEGRAGERGSASKPKITLDTGSLIRDLEVIERENEAVRAAASRHRGPVFRLEYESFFSSAPDLQAKAVADLLGFLGVERQTLKSEHRRLREMALCDAIENYEEVRKALIGGPFERWLADGARA